MSSLTNIGNILKTISPFMYCQKYFLQIRDANSYYADFKHTSMNLLFFCHRITYLTPMTSWTRISMMKLGSWSLRHVLLHLLIWSLLKNLTRHASPV